MRLGCGFFRDLWKGWQADPDHPRGPPGPRGFETLEIHVGNFTEAYEKAAKAKAKAEARAKAKAEARRIREEKARAKERFFSHRDTFGQWDPKNQRPELWNLFNGKKGPQENFRIFPLSNWTEMDVWQYAKIEKIELRRNNLVPILLNRCFRIFSVPFERIYF